MAPSAAQSLDQVVSIVTLPSKPRASVTKNLYIGHIRTDIHLVATKQGILL